MLHDRRSPHGVGVTCVIGTVHHHPMGDVIGAPEVPTERLVDSIGRRLKSSPERKPSPPLEPLGHDQGCISHVLAGLGEGGRFLLHMIDCHGAVCLKR
jgi:hypothetical protein